MAAPRVRVLPPASKEGHELSNYRLLERIGEDDLATVYRAVHTTLDRPVDVHILRRSDRVSASRFQLAGRLGARLHHPNIMPVIDAGHDDHYGDYLVTPRLAGRTLAEVFRTGLMESLLALRVFSQIGAALDSIHQQQIVHRDVRPEHVVLTPQGTAYLTSFGLAATPDELDLSSVDDADFGVLACRGRHVPGVADHPRPAAARSTPRRARACRGPGSARAPCAAPCAPWRLRAGGAASRCR